MSATETLARYKALAGQATKGPWEATENGLLAIDPETGVELCVAEFVKQADEEFITASRALGPAMAAALQEILDYHSPATLWEETGRGPEYYKRCSRCVYTTNYPCPTVAIIKHLEGK